MSDKIIRSLWGIVSTALLALYLFAFYQLCIIPAILDWSSLGVILTLALAGLLIVALPKEKRLPLTVLGITFLLLMEAFYNISSYPAPKLVLSYIIIFVVLLFVGKLLGRMSFRRYLVVFVVALILNSTVNIPQAPFWTEFLVKWQSPQLYPRYASVDYFPVQLIDVDDDGVKEIISQANLKRASAEQEEVAKKGREFQILSPESNHFAVYKWNEKTFKELAPDKYDLHKLQTSLPLDYLGYPFYRTTVSVNTTTGIEEKMDPVLDKAEIIEQSMNFGKFPFKFLSLSQNSLADAIKNRSLLEQPVNSAELAGGLLVPGEGRKKIIIDEKLKVIQPTDQKVIAELGRSQVPDIGTSEVLTGDVNNDKIDELILTAETSQILQLTQDYKWEVLWSNPEPRNFKDRFNKMRFEDFALLGSDKSPQLIALSKSNVRDNPTRYMTGYVYNDGTLKQKWRVFSGLINLRAGDIDGDGQNELLGYMYRAHRIYVLEKHNVPVVGILYGITGALILLGFSLRWRKKYPLLTILVTALILTSGCSIKSGPKEFVKTPKPDIRQVTDASEKLAKAFETTARDGNKFYFSGWQVTKIQKRSISLITNGSFDKSKGYILDARIFGQPYRYYRWGSDVYLSQSGKWRKAAPSVTPVEPFVDFNKLQFLTGKAVQLPDEAILSKKCNVYQITLNYDDAVKVAEAMGLNLSGDAGTGTDRFISRLNMTFTIWTGKSDNFIYQFQTATNMPVPEAGSLYQEVKYKFWDYNSSTVNVPGPEKIRRYLITE